MTPYFTHLSTYTPLLFFSPRRVAITSCAADPNYPPPTDANYTPSPPVHTKPRTISDAPGPNLMYNTLFHPPLDLYPPPYTAKPLENATTFSSPFSNEHTRTFHLF